MIFICFRDIEHGPIFVRASEIVALLSNPEGGSFVVVEGTRDNPIRVVDEVEELASLLESHVPECKIVYYS